MVIFPLFALVPYLETVVYERLAQRDFERILRDQDEQYERRAITRSPRGRKRKKAPHTAGQPLSESESETNASGAPGAAEIVGEYISGGAEYLTGATKLIGSEASKVLAPRDGITWHNFRVPAFKFYTRLILDVFLALFATFASLVDANITTEELSRWRVVFFVWAIGGLIEEWSQIGSDWRNELLSLWQSDKVSMYRADPFNWIDFFTFHGLFICLCLDEEAWPIVRVSLWSAMTVGCWLRMLRVLQMIPSLGPLLLMFFQMFRDVGQLLILEIFVLAGFSAGVSTLFSSKLFVSSQPVGMMPYNPPPDQCSGFLSLQGDFQSFQHIFFVFFNGVFTGSTHVRALLDAFLCPLLLPFLSLTLPC